MLSLISCKKNLQTQDLIISGKFENLHKDPIFLEYILIIQKQVSLIKDVQQLKSFSDNFEKSNYVKKTIYKTFGYSDSEIFWKDQSQQKERIIYLSQKYNITKFSKQRILNETLKAFSNPDFIFLYNSSNLSGNTFGKVINFNINKDSNNNLVDDQDLCNKIRVNCILGYGAAAVVGHIMCGAADVTIVLGLICHAAVLGVQILGQDNCNLQYQLCKGQGNYIPE